MEGEQMKTYHFSCRFSNSDWNYHGIFLTSFTEKSDIVNRAKIAVTEKLVGWKKNAKDMIFFEVYYFDDDGKEVNIFSFIA